MMSRLALRPVIVALGLGLAAPALAQSSTAPTAAPAAAISASHLAVARDVVVSSGIARSIDTIAPQFAEQVRQTFSATRPEIMKDLNEVLTALRPEVDKERDEMVMATARIFAQRMSEAELTEIARFFASPAGKHYVEAQPQMLDAMFNQMQAWTQRLSENIVTRVRAEMRKRGHEI